VLLGVSASSAIAQGSLNVTVVGATSTQVILQYTAPTADACTVEASESSTYRPLVRDVDPSLFPQSNLDTRNGNLVSGQARVLVIGSRSSATASDQNVYSRALQTNTRHYFRITCGGATGAATATTANIPVGMTYNDGPQVDTANPGQWKMPTRLEDRTQTTIDPQTGALLHQVSLDAESGRANGYNGMFLTYGGFNRVCDSRLVGPAGGPLGFVCTFPRYGQQGMTAYWIIPSTGEVRMLGGLPILDGGPVGPLTADLYAYGDDGHGNTVRVTYVGNFQASNSAAPIDNWLTYSTVPISQMMHDFDSTFDTSVYGCGTAWAGAGQYKLFVCGSGGQDSPGWLGVLYGGDGRPIQPGCTAGDACPRIVAAMNVFQAKPTRYCGLHNVQQLGNLASINVQAVANQPTCAAFGHLIYWRFLSDPHGTDTTNTTVVVDYYFDGGGHWDYGPLGRVTEQGSWAAVFGTVEDHLNQPLSLVLDDSPLFSGVKGISYGSTLSKHPSYHQVAGIAPSTELGWFMDALSFDGGQFYSTPAGATPISGQLYKWNPSSESPPLSRKQLPTLAISGGYSLLDVSGPRSSLSDGSADSYKYCVAFVAGECRAGSAAGDVYVNAPNVKYLNCVGSDGPNPQNLDICVGNLGTYAQGIPQLFLGSDAADSTKRSRVITYGLTGLRQSFYYWTAKSLPDASWALFTRGLAQPPFGDLLTVWMAKLPPLPAPDGVDRSNFLPLTVNLTPPANSQIARAIIQFGYAEQGRPDQYYCTSRREACVAASAAFTADNPFQYANSETYAGVPCAASCQITIPVLPMHVVYYKVLYLDASRNVVATGIQGVSAELNNASVSGSSSTTPAPPQPTGLAGTSTAIQVVLSWTSGGGSTAGFNVYRNGSLIGKVTAPTYTDSNLDPSTAYTYTVAAYDSSGNLSPMSNSLTISTQAQVNVTVSPRTATVAAGGSQGFTATVTGTANTAVKWSLGSAVGTISPAGIYTAPARVSVTQRVIVFATSVADPGTSGSAVVTVQIATPGALKSAVQK
jgi:chitodextrinase